MKTTKYFPHDADYLDDPRIIKLIERYKMAGYGILFSLYEMLLKHEDYRFHHSEIRMHCRRINVKTVLVKAVLNDFDLFSFDGEYYSSDDFSQKMKNYDDKKRKNILKKEVEEKANLVKLNQQKNEYDALLNDIESNRIKLNRIEGDEEKEKEKEPTDNDNTSFSDSIVQPGTLPEADINSNSAPASDADVHTATGLAVSQPPASTRGNGKMSDEEYEKLALKNSLEEMERGVDRAFRDQCWLEVIAMNQHMPIEYIHQIPLMSRVFKDHIIQQGKVRAMSNPEEAKRYFANFARDGSATRTILDERMRMRLRKEVPYPFEDVDPITGQRSVCGVPVPSDAPPRPDYSMRWNVEKKKWTC